jgi:hypothetical protein
MAGRPKRRAFVEQVEAALADLEPLPPEATVEQQRERARAILRTYRKATREQGVRAGRVSPRTHGEAAMFASDIKDSHKPGREEGQDDKA